MTIENYTQLSNEELIQHINSIGVKFTNIERFIQNHFNELFLEIHHRTEFLDDYFNSRSQKVPFRARTYCLEHNITEHPKCKNPSCKCFDNRVGWNRGGKCFMLTCCLKCAQENPTTIVKKMNTNIAKWGVPHTGQSNEVKEKARITNRLKYGVDYSFQSKLIMDKIKASMLTRYGVDNYNKAKISHRSRRKRILFDGIWFDSKLEVKFYKYCTEHNLSCEYQPEISLPYEYDGIEHIYHPDFLVNGQLVEVKGDHFFRFNESTGKEEMFCPYGLKKLGESKWNQLCELYEAKHQCMIANHVIILRNSDIRDLNPLNLENPSSHAL